MLPMKTTPSAMAGEVTIGPAVLNVHLTVGDCVRPASRYTPVRAASAWKVACACASVARAASSTNVMIRIIFIPPAGREASARTR